MPNAKRQTKGLYAPKLKERLGVIVRSLASLMARSVKGPCIAFVVLLVALMPSAIGSRFAGYEYDGYAQGVFARIYTIDPDIWIPYKALSEHVAVYLSYYNGYWVQVGYRKKPGYGIDFYMEKQDRNGYSKTILGSVSPYTWHTYKIAPGYTGQWRIYIDGAYKGQYVTDPKVAAVIAALVETKGVIMIDGSDFRDISYYDDWAGRWYLWRFHDVVEDDPYHVIELYDYWFMAWGGG